MLTKESRSLPSVRVVVYFLSAFIIQDYTDVTILSLWVQIHMVVTLLCLLISREGFSGAFNSFPLFIVTLIASGYYLDFYDTLFTL